MLPFLIIVISIPLLSVLWLWWADRRLRRLQAHRGWRRLVMGTGVLFLAGYTWIFLQRLADLPKPPPALYAFVLLWAIVFLPFLALPTAFLTSLWQAVTRIGERIRRRPAATPLPPGGSGCNRRRFLATGLTALPAIATIGSTFISLPQKRHFRVREITVPLRGLPRDLEGFTITHLSDTHVGKFTHGRVLHELAEAANQLRSHLIVTTGDLIDHDIDDLPEALDWIERLDAPLGVVSVEGNHDLFQDPQGFADGFAGRGLPLLRDAVARAHWNGHPIDLAGLRWAARSGLAPGQLDGVRSLADPDAFSILLAHHPHVFDAAAETGVGLVLAGHTHGGQLMLTSEIGPGPLMFRYWSGLYRKDSSALVVSNGAGNWFPLRTAAPAEIIHLTLRST